MIALLSPAKKLDANPLSRQLPCTQPMLKTDTSRLVSIAKRLSVPELQALMKLSPGLAQLNHERFQAFGAKSTKQAGKPAMLLFAGDTYAGLKAWELDDDACHYAQRHLLILSGLYGLLRPLDIIQPYRLEMGSRLVTPRGTNLYQFWGKRIAQALNRCTSDDCAAIVNLSSIEYFSAVDRASLHAPVLTCVFKEGTERTSRVIGFSAKKARGMMARFMIDHRVTKPTDLRDFNASGYRYSSKQSTSDTLVFLRPR